VQERRYFHIASPLTPRRVLAPDRPNRSLDTSGFTILDLTGGGLLASAASSLAIGEGERPLLVMMLDDEAIEVAVTVVWVRPLPSHEASELGCRFDALTSRDQIAILDHIRRNHVRAAT